MNRWNEDDFLEKLAPQLRRKLRSERGPCPDAETLSAVLEGTLRGPLREQVIEHLARCHSCATLQSRLSDFDDETLPKSETEWNQAQTRLDNWLESFLRSQAASRPSKRSGPWGLLSLHGIARTIAARRFQWALTATIAVFLAIGGALLLRRGYLQRIHNPEVVLRTAPEPPQVVRAPATQPTASPRQATENPQPFAAPQQPNAPNAVAAVSEPGPPQTPSAQPSALISPTGQPAGGLVTEGGATNPAPVVLANGPGASFGSGGRITQIHDPQRHMVIECGLRPTDRRITTEGYDTRLVTLGPNSGYFERPYLNRNGQSYYQRTYWAGGQIYARAYRLTYYYGMRYYTYAPTEYYNADFYRWATAPWPSPVHYAWGWGESPWYTYYGPYFAPASDYSSASFWLTDFLLADDLRLAYEAAQNRPAGEESAAESGSRAAVQLTPEVKAVFAGVVRQQVDAEGEEAARTSAASGSITPVKQTQPAVLDRAQRLILVPENLTLFSAEGPECELTGGEVIARLDDMPDQEGWVRVTVLSSKQNGCAVGTPLLVQAADLQEMHNDFHEQLHSALKSLASELGKGGLPPAPDITMLPGEVPPPNPDSHVRDRLRNQQQQAVQLEAEVQQQIRNGRIPNGVVTTPFASPAIVGQGPGEPGVVGARSASGTTGTSLGGPGPRTTMPASARTPTKARPPARAGTPPLPKTKAPPPPKPRAPSPPHQ